MVQNVQGGETLQELVMARGHLQESTRQRPRDLCLRRKTRGRGQESLGQQAARPAESQTWIDVVQLQPGLAAGGLQTPSEPGAQASSPGWAESLPHLWSKT